jgi:RimJ/RimL family protein N-acetyltransferase
MILEKPIVTKRLQLRTLSKDDATEHYLCWMEDSAISRYLESGQEKQTLASIAAYIEDKNRSADDLLLGIFVREGGSHIGNIKLGGIDPYHRRAHIGILIGEKLQWGKGYATETIEALVSYAGSILNLFRVYAGCHASNSGSVCAFLKAGFEEEGRLRKHDRIDDEWVDSIILGRLLP